MCDKAHYDELEARVSVLERTDAVHDEKFVGLYDSVKTLRNVMYTFALIMLLALVYGALGPRGFNAVTATAQGTHGTHTQGVN